MATKFYTWTGKVKWAKVREDQKDTKFDDAGVYSIVLYPDEAAMASIKESGIQNEWKTDEDGDYITLRRRHEQIIKRELATFGPPEVNYERKPFTGSIGNGSTVAVNVAVFDTKKGKGSRLERITIRELVEYNSPKNMDDAIPF